MGDTEDPTNVKGSLVHLAAVTPLSWTGTKVWWKRISARP